MAADSVEGAGFWLPSEFFDDFIIDNENIRENNVTESDSTEFRFPTEFPYDFTTKRDELLEISQKRWVTSMSTSPQSTLSQIGGGSSNGSLNGYPSLPTAPKHDAVGDLIYHAAGQVARMKLHNGDVAGPTKHKGPMVPPPAKTPDPSIISNIYLQQQMKQQKLQGREMWQQLYACPIQQNPTCIVGSGGRAALFGGAVKRGCAGTGVFLPRRYGNNDCNAFSSDSRKRTGYPAPVINRNVHAMNKNFDNMNGYPQSQSHYQPKLGRCFVSEYGILMARRNALLLQHQRSLLLEGSTQLNRGVYLPQEWTY